MIVWMCQRLSDAPWRLIRSERSGSHVSRVAIVISKSVPKVFGNEDRVLAIREPFRWSELLRECGAYASSSEARRAGWNKDIAVGFTECEIKRKLGFRPFMYEFLIYREA